MADYCIRVAPDICAPCKYWHSNDGDGLDAAGALALADALETEIDAGRTEAYARRYASDAGNDARRALRHLRRDRSAKASTRTKA